MQLGAPILEELHSLACNTAILAGKVISQYSDPTKIQITQKKESGHSPASQIVTEVDYQVESLIIKQLTPSINKYDLALLSEESHDGRQRLEKDYFWCIDPLDGTLAFTQSQPGYSVSIALLAKDGTPIIGVVFNPITQDLYSAIKGQGVYKNDSILKINPISEKETLTLPCDQSFLNQTDFSYILEDLQHRAQQLGYTKIELVRGQGAVMNAITVLERSPGIYFKRPKSQIGGGSIWDFAATACIFLELGLITSDFGGNKLNLNPEGSTFMNKHGVLFSSDQSLLTLISNISRIEEKPI